VLQTRSCSKRQIPKTKTNKNMVWNANKKQVVSTSPTNEKKPNCQSQVPSGSTFYTLPFVNSRRMTF